MTDDFAPYSPELKRAARRVEQALPEVARRQMKEATLYFFGADDDMLIEGRIEEPHLVDVPDAGQLRVQLARFERVQKAPFVARFFDTGKESQHTNVAVHPLGSNPKVPQPDETYLRLRDILRKKREQLPKGARGIILLDITELDKLAVDERTLLTALYGDMEVTLRAGEEHFELSHLRNGFFAQTSRVSAVVVEKTRVAGDDIESIREVFPTNNPATQLLTRAELGQFGTPFEDLNHLCRPG